MLPELTDIEKTCDRCEHADDNNPCCGGCSRAWSGGHIEDACNDYWIEAGWSVRARADKRVSELEAELARERIDESNMEIRYEEAKARAEKAETERDEALNSVKEICQHVESWCGKHPVSQQEVWQILKDQRDATNKRIEELESRLRNADTVRNVQLDAYEFRIRAIKNELSGLRSAAIEMLKLEERRIFERYPEAPELAPCSCSGCRGLLDALKGRS